MGEVEQFQILDVILRPGAFEAAPDAQPASGTAAPPAQMAAVDILAEADRRLAEVDAERRRAEERMAREAAAFEQMYPKVEAEAA